MTAKGQDDLYQLIQELKRDLIEYFDLIIRRLARLRMLEERLDILEEYITDIKGRFRKIEYILADILEKERKVTPPIYAPTIERPRRRVAGIREERSVAVIRPLEEAPREVVAKPVTKHVRTDISAEKAPTVTQPKMEEKPKITITKEITEDDLAIKYSKLTQTEKQILKVLIRNPNLRGGTSIARRIGKAREHTCRLLKKLTQKGFLIRDESVWPYAYFVPEKVKQMVMLEEQLNVTS
ncbi:MAG: hypothetical protein NDF55_04520 [archaeon GB-1867-005]|nr:hypothetical protein [Candidatus Culexmicrobium cathedralense]